jgi:uncharacterized protein
MMLADDELQLTELYNSRVENILRLTDDVVLQQLVDLKPRTSELRQAQKLASNYMKRRLVKCVFEKVVQRKDMTIQKIFSQKRFRDELASDIAHKAHMRSSDVYIDVPNTRAVPYTHERQAFNTITLFSSNLHGGRKTETIPVSELPLVGSITGFMDILRIYTSPEHRSRVTNAVEGILGKEDFMSRISI